MSQALPSTFTDEWLNTIYDSQLRFLIMERSTPGKEEDVVRAAFVLLERRIRESTGLAPHYYGKDLIDAAFHPDTGRLQPISPVGAERAGLHNLMLGLMLYYRNPVAHRPMYYTEQSQRLILSLIDHALELVLRAAEQVVDLEEFVGPHEGEITQRRDFRIDIDDDGLDDVVALIEVGPTWEDGELASHLLPVVLKNLGGKYLRIPSPWIRGQSMHGAMNAELRRISSPDRADLVVQWAWGEAMDLYLCLRFENDRYMFMERELEEGTDEPYDGASRKGFTTHAWRKEVVQTLRFDSEDLEKMGYPTTAPTSDSRLAVCRVWSWDTTKQLLVKSDERLILETR